MRLKRELGESALWLPARLWCFAAIQDGTGSVADYTADELAEALGFKGNAKEMLRALKSAGYIGTDGTITDWQEIFGLYKSRQQAGRTRVMNRWGKKTSPSTPPPSETRQEEKTQEERRGESDVIPDVLRYVPPSPMEWPINLTPEQVEEIGKDTMKPTDFIVSQWPAWRDKKMRFGDEYAKEGFAGFRDMLRKAKYVMPPKATAEGPPRWRERLESRYPGNLINIRGDPWSAVDRGKQIEIENSSEYEGTF